MALAAPKPELTVPVATVHGNPRVAKAVQHIPEQGEKTGALQPVTTEPSIGSVEVVVHLLKTREKQINISSMEQRQQTQNSK
jgi:ATP adenylyltransferase/5',5'''-P-1,P-4-tetraphosphate phosphorylase II